MGLVLLGGTSKRRSQIMILCSRLMCGGGKKHPFAGKWVAPHVIYHLNLRGGCKKEFFVNVSVHV
jgi:hypothetical protein